MRRHSERVDRLIAVIRLMVSTGVISDRFPKRITGQLYLGPSLDFRYSLVPRTTVSSRAWLCIALVGLVLFTSLGAILLVGAYYSWVLVNSQLHPGFLSVSIFALLILAAVVSLACFVLGKLKWVRVILGKHFCRISIPARFLPLAFSEEQLISGLQAIIDGDASRDDL